MENGGGGAQRAERGGHNVQNAGEEHNVHNGGRHNVHHRAPPKMGPRPFGVTV